MSEISQHGLPAGAQSGAHDGAFHAQPSFAQRAWRALGFRYHLGDDPLDADKLQGWMCTENRFRFSLADRLRLLISGRLYVRLVQHTPVQCDFSRNRLDWHIEPPGSP